MMWRPRVARLRPVYPDDQEFRAAFTDKSLRTTSSRNNKVVRFILFRLKRSCRDKGLNSKAPSTALSTYYRRIPVMAGISSMTSSKRRPPIASAT